MRGEARYPGYDVLSKRNTPSWNEQNARGHRPDGSPCRASPAFSPRKNSRPSAAIAARIVPQPRDRPPIPVAALIDDKITQRERATVTGARRMPPKREAWRRGLRALNAEAREAHGREFRALNADEQDALLGGCRRAS